MTLDFFYGKVCTSGSHHRDMRHVVYSTSFTCVQRAKTKCHIVFNTAFRTFAKFVQIFATAVQKKKKHRPCLFKMKTGLGETIQLLTAGPEKACAVEAKFNRHTRGSCG